MSGDMDFISNKNVLGDRNVYNFIFFLQTWFLDVSEVMSIFHKIVYEKRSVFGNKFKYFYVQQTTFKKGNK